MESTKGMLFKDQEFYRRKKESIDQLLLHPKVIQLLNQNHLDRHFIEEHWIDFLNFVEDLQQCANCHNIDECPKSFPGYQRQLVYENNQLSSELTVCPYGKERENQRLVFNHITTNLPKSMLLTTLMDVEPDNEGNLFLLISKLTDDVKIYPKKGYYVYGNMGIGKTYVTAAFCNMLALQKKDCAFISVSQLLQDLKGYFNSDEDNGLEYLKKVPYLVLDDIGAETLSTWGRDEILYNLLNARMLEHLPTYFTSVYDLEGLQAHYMQNKTNDESIKVQRLIERIKALSEPYHLYGKKYR